jgi:hypothetical protein
MRCFFHLFHRDETILDTEGVDVENLDQLQSEVLKALNELRREEEPFATWKGWTLRVIAEAGAPLFTTNLLESVPRAFGHLADDLLLQWGQDR